MRMVNSEGLLWVELLVSGVELLKIVSVFNRAAGHFENGTLQEEFHGVIEEEMHR